MRGIFVNILRGVKKRILQYLGILILLIVVISSISALYSNAQRLQSAFYTVSDNSKRYDYRVNLKLLNNYKDIDESTAEIKEVLKSHFPDEAAAIDSISANDIRNNILPKNIGATLKNYLLDWGVSYQGILVNDILANDRDISSNYNLTPSFFKTFDYQTFINGKQVFYTFEDAFYVKSTPEKSSAFEKAPNRNNINEVYIVAGTKPVNANEVIINPFFAQNYGLKINDILPFSEKQTVPLKIVGYGYAYWGIMGNRTTSNLNPTPDNTTPVYMTQTKLNQLIDDYPNYKTKIDNILLLKINGDQHYFADRLQTVLIKTFNFNLGTVITTDLDDTRSGQILEIFQMQDILFSAITLVVLLVIIFIILSYVRKEVDIQKPQLGLLKALGYRDYQIAFGFVFLIFVITLIANLCGFTVGLGLQALFNSLNKIGFFLPLVNVYFSLITFIISLIVVPCIFMFVSFWQAKAKLAISPLVLIYDRPSSGSSKIIEILKFPFRYWPFKQRLAIAFTLKSVGKLFLVFFTFVFVSFLLLFQSIATDLFDNKISNLYDYFSQDVKWYTTTNSMYSYQGNGANYFDKQIVHIDKQLFNWASEDDINKNISDHQQDPSVEQKYFPWVASDFQIDNDDKLVKLEAAVVRNNFINNFVNADAINKLYQASQSEETWKQFINPIDLIPSDIWNEIANLSRLKVNDFLTNFAITTGTDIASGVKLPGISLGLNIYNGEQYYPSIETPLRAVEKWKDHDQGNIQMKLPKVIGIYNNAQQKIAWKNWFNFKEEKNRDLSPIFNSAHDLPTQIVTYTNSEGKEETGEAFVVPAVVSKLLAVLNHYKVNSKFLMLTSWYNYKIPVIYDVQGIIENNLDASDVYTNLDDLRTALHLTTAALPPAMKSKMASSPQPLSDSFNYLLSKSNSVFPLNYASSMQTEGKYGLTTINKDTIAPINKTYFVKALIKALFTNIFSGIRTIINILKFLTLFGVTFILIIIVNIILDNNLLIIAMMKSLGYRINEINRLIIGSYIIALIVAFVLGTILSYVVWNIITLIVANRSGAVFNVPISPVTILISFAMVSLIMVISYLFGLYIIKYKPVTSLLQNG